MTGAAADLHGTAKRSEGAGVTVVNLKSEIDRSACRVRGSVAAEFVDAVVLREYCADGRNLLLCCHIDYGNFVQSGEIGWDYKASCEGSSTAIGATLGTLAVE